ncbi:MAG: hypothetical protein ACREFX_03445, partial [Opitutaceae bacterium]
ALLNLHRFDSRAMKPPFRLPLVFSLAAAVFALGGCASAPQPRPYSVRVTLDNDLVGSSIEVDLVGVNTIADLPKWQNYSVTQYWQPQDTFRHDAHKYTMQFGPGTAKSFTLLSTDPIWKDWLGTGATNLVVMADLPEAAADQSGNADPRRLILPLDKHAWGSDVNTIDILVQESGLKLLTAHKP